MFLLKIDEWLRKPLAFFVLLFIFLSLAIVTSQSRDINGDENDYYNYGVRCVKGHPERVYWLDDSKSVLIFPAVVPRVIAQVINPHLRKNDDGQSDMRMGMMAMLIYSVGILFLLWRILIRLRLSYVMLILPVTVIDPLLASYSTVLETDLACGFFTLALFYFAWLYYDTRRMLYLLGFAIAAGLGFVCKFSFIPVLIGFCCGSLLVIAHRLFDKKFIFFLVKSATIAAIVALFVIHVSYPTDKRFVPLNKMALRSEKFNQISHSFIGSIPVPLPQNIVQAADLLSFHAQPGLPKSDRTNMGAVWVLGKLRKSPVIYFNWVLIFFKLPIFFLGLWVAGIVFSIKLFKKFRFLFLSTFVSLFFIVYSDFLNPFQSGIRHLLAVYPLFFVTAALAIHKFAAFFTYKPAKVLLMAGFVSMMISVTYYFPYEEAYTNEFILDKKNAYWYVSDGCIDYSHYSRYRHEFIKANPAYTYPAPNTKPGSGKYAASVSELFSVGIWENDSLAASLWYKGPDRVEKFTLLIFDGTK